MIRLSLHSKDLQHDRFSCCVRCWCNHLVTATGLQQCSDMFCAWTGQELPLQQPGTRLMQMCFQRRNHPLGITNCGDGQLMYLLELSARDGTGKGRGISGEGTGLRGDGGAWGHPLPIVDGTCQCCLPWAAHYIGTLCASHHSSCIPQNRFTQHAYFYQQTKMSVLGTKDCCMGRLCATYISSCKATHWLTESHTSVCFRDKLECQDVVQSSLMSACDLSAHA